MKTVWLVLILAGVFVFREAGAQVWVKAEYIGSSPFRDENNEKVGGKGDMMQPELTLSRSFSIPLTIGFVADRAAYYDDRSLKAFFKGMSREYDPHFSPAFYASVGIKYGF